MARFGMPLLELLSGSWIGSLVGMRHALEPDHLAAVGTLVSRERSALRAAVLGACWGLGHTLALMATGALLVLIRAEMPHRLTLGFELLVAVMLVGLGVRAIVQAIWQGGLGPPHRHRHGGTEHIHGGAQAHVHVGRWTLARRPLLVGVVHGLAGSGALTALVLATLPSNGARLAYVALFGLGSTIGMAALSGLFGWPLARLSTHQTFARTVSLLVGGVSTVLGLTWGYPIVGQLF
jgi:hypothetical protein